MRVIYFSITGQKRGNVLQRILCTSIQTSVYVCVCDPPLITLFTAWLISVTVEKSAAVPLKIHSSFIDGGIGSLSSEYPVYGKSEVLLGHDTSLRRNVQ